MLNSLIQKSTDYLISRNIIDADDRDIYEYGFHSLYSNVIIFSFIGLISIAIHQFPQTVIYHIAFILMRNNAGGYHAKTQMRCFFISIAIWGLSLWIISNISSPTLTICLTLFSTVLIWIKAPIEHENNPMNEKKQHRMAIRSRVISTGLLVAIAFICAFSMSHMWVAVSLAIGMVSHALLFATALLVSRDK